MTTRWPGRGLVAMAALVSACAARGPSPRLLADMSAAAEHRDAGCYSCLIEALGRYERVAAGPRAPREAVRDGFESAVMLVVRAKELGLPSDVWLTRAQALAARLPAAGAGLTPDVYLAAARAVVGETSGLDPEARQQRMRVPRVGGNSGPQPERVELDGAAPSDWLAGYLALTLDCDDASSRVRVDRDAIITRYGSMPAFRFRLAICGVAPAELLPLREADPRWTDTLLFEGRRQMAMRPISDVVKATELFAAARLAFPESHAITLSLAGAQQALSEFAAALANYDTVLDDEPTHRDAWLGRVMSLSYLTRYVDAVVAATRLIELGTWHVGDAYYWRAWNRYQLHQLPAAWEDIERATTLLVNSSVYTLAGFIAYARTELDTAIDRFDRAFAMDRTNCEAVWFSGLVHVDQQGWSPAAPKFSTAMACFTAAATAARSELDALASASYAEALKARRLASLQKQIETAEHRAAQSAFNAAQCFLRLGRKGEASSHLESAATHPLLREKAATLKPAIERLPG